MVGGFDWQFSDLYSAGWLPLHSSNSSGMSDVGLSSREGWKVWNCRSFIIVCRNRVPRLEGAGSHFLLSLVQRAAAICCGCVVRFYLLATGCGAARCKTRS